MPRPGHAMFLAVLFVLQATIVSAQAPREEQSSASTAPPAAAPSAAEIKARADRKIMQAELAQNDERVQREVAALEARIKLTDDAATRMLIQRHIETAKLSAAAESFRIQLRHAQAMGRADDVKELQAVLDARMKLQPLALPALPPVATKAVAPSLPASNKKAVAK